MNYFNSLFQSLDKANETLQKRKIEEKLDEIERMLYDFYPHDRVQILVAEWKNRLNATTDYNGFYRELDDYRSTLVNRYFGQ